MIKELLGAAAARVKDALPTERLRGAAQEGARRVAREIGPHIPPALRAQIPDFTLQTSAYAFVMRSGHLSVSPARGPDLPHSETESASPPSPGPTAEAGPAGFWGTLPRGVKTGMADIDGETEMKTHLPSQEEPVRALIQRLRDTIENLDDVESFDVVEAVDDDMYQLWKELERKMQSHRRSEAKHQLKDMFSI